LWDDPPKASETEDIFHFEHLDLASTIDEKIVQVTFDHLPSSGTVEVGLFCGDVPKSGKLPMKTAYRVSRIFHGEICLRLFVGDELDKVREIGAVTLVSEPCEWTGSADLSKHVLRFRREHKQRVDSLPAPSESGLSGFKFGAEQQKALTDFWQVDATRVRAILESSNVLTKAALSLAEKDVSRKSELLFYAVALESCASPESAYPAGRMMRDVLKRKADLLDEASSAKRDIEGQTRELQVELGAAAGDEGRGAMLAAEVSELRAELDSLASESLCTG
jgi:hypothetical protein